MYFLNAVRNVSPPQIERLGRRRTMALEFVLVSAGLCVLFRCTGDRTLVTAALFLVRGAASGVFQAAYVYTPEVRRVALKSGISLLSGTFETGIKTRRPKMSLNSIFDVCRCTRRSCGPWGWARAQAWRGRARC